jgi:pyruvate formate lyase activating enzyme
LCRSGAESLDRRDFFSFLKKRRGLLEGVVISGGEPTIQPDLEEFVAAVKDLGYLVKLDTNGSSPQTLERLMKAELLDYVALDLKTDPSAYPPSLAPPALAANIPATMKILKSGAVPFEYRTTCAAPFVDRQTILAIAKAAAGSAPLFLQSYRPAVVLNPQFMRLHPHQPKHEDLLFFKELAEAYLPCFIRGV